MSITTGRGDDGGTDLWFGDRAPKSSPQVEALGALDEAKAALGLARSEAPPWMASEILKIQKDLFLVSSEVATLRGKVYRLKERPGPELLDWAMGQIVRYEKIIQITDWVISGDSHLGAELDLATTFIRRAERRCAYLQEEGFIDNRNLLVFVNRLSDLVFLMARAADREIEVPE
jgi:cob(I)alamin adenosyltransferase